MKFAAFLFAIYDIWAKASVQKDGQSPLERSLSLQVKVRARYDWGVASLWDTSSSFVPKIPNHDDKFRRILGKVVNETFLNNRRASSSRHQADTPRANLEELVAGRASFQRGTSDTLLALIHSSQV